MTGMALLLRFKKSVTMTLLLLMALLPALTAVLLLRFSFQANFTDLTPVWTDELYYWHQALSFRDAGFETGFYTVNEIPAPADFTHFYAWGPMIPVMYGTLARFTGWTPTTMPLINLALVTLAMLIVLWQMRLSWRLMLLTGFAVSSYSPLLLNGIASGVVSLDIAIALISAAGFYRLLREREQTPRSIWLSLVLFFIAAATIRLTWGLFLLPLLILAQPKTLIRQTGAIVAGLLLVLVCAAFYQWTSAPFPYAFGEALAMLWVDVHQAVTLWLDLINLNLTRFSEGDWLERHLRYVTVALLLAVTITGGYIAVRRKVWHDAPQWLWELAFHLFNLGSVFLFNVFVYDMAEWRDYRQFAPRLLLSLILFILCRRRWFALGLMALLLISLPPMKTIYDIWTGYHLDEVRAAEYPYWHEKLQPLLEYDPAASSPWCNTVLHSTRYSWSQVPLLLAVDGGMGLSSPLNEHPDLPFLSRYIMLDNGYYATIAASVPHLEPLLELPGGWLYHNPDSACYDD